MPAYDHMGGRASQAYGTTVRVAPCSMWSPSPVPPPQPAEVVAEVVPMGEVVPR
jgi:hypothetical protein